jgi:hypothetical protein
MITKYSSNFLSSSYIYNPFFIYFSKGGKKMKKALFIYSIDGALIFISTIIGSIILTLLRISNKIDNQGYNITVLVVSNVIFLLGGLFLGLR